MNAVIVTGATSMLGIATIQVCIENGVRVIALTRANSRRKSYLPKSELLMLIECDLSDLSKVNLPEDDYDVFFHFGWGFTDRTTRDDPVLQSKNIGYTLDAVQLAHKYGCRKFLGAGSQAEYGFHTERITEETSITPEVCYGYAKYAAGKLAEKLCNRLGIICIWTRTFSVYGRYDSENTMIPYALRQYKKGDVAQFSSGMQMWDYLFEEDAGKYFYLLGEKAEKNVLVNVASGNVKLLRAYIEEMAEALNKIGSGRLFLYELEREGEDNPLNGIDPCVRKLREITGYIPQIGFAEGIKKILEFNSRKDEREIYL